MVTVVQWIVTLSIISGAHAGLMHQKKTDLERRSVNLFLTEPLPPSLPLTVLPPLIKIDRTAPESRAAERDRHIYEKEMKCYQLRAQAYEKKHLIWKAEMERVERELEAMNRWQVPATP